MARFTRISFVLGTTLEVYPVADGGGNGVVCRRSLTPSHTNQPIIHDMAACSSYSIFPDWNLTPTSPPLPIRPRTSPAQRTTRLHGFERQIIIRCRGGGGSHNGVRMVMALGVTIIRSISPRHLTRHSRSPTKNSLRRIHTCVHTLHTAYDPQRPAPPNTITTQ